MKNKHNLQRIIGGLIFAVGIVFIIITGIVTTSGSENARDAGMVWLLIALPFLAVGAIWYLISTSNSRGVCDECGGKMKGCAYEYQEIKREYASSNSNQIVVKFKIIAECPHCGAKKDFEKEFRVNPNENVQYKVDQFCRNHFGH